MTNIEAVRKWLRTYESLSSGRLGVDFLPEKAQTLSLIHIYIQYAVIGVDFGGTKSAHSFTLTGLTKGFRQIVILDEFYHDNKKNGRLSPKQVEDAFVDFVRRAKRRYRVYEAYCDSAEQTLIEGLKVASVRSRLGIDIKNAQKRPINDRIAFYNSMIAQDRFRIMKSCTAHIKAFEEAVYDPDEPVKDIRLDDGTTDIDSLDSMEYARCV